MLYKVSGALSSEIRKHQPYNNTRPRKLLANAAQSAADWHNQQKDCTHEDMKTCDPVCGNVLHVIDMAQGILNDDCSRTCLLLNSLPFRGLRCILPRGFATRRVCNLSKSTTCCRHLLLWNDAGMTCGHADGSVYFFGRPAPPRPRPHSWNRSSCVLFFPFRALRAGSMQALHLFMQFCPFAQKARQSYVDLQFLHTACTQAQEATRACHSSRKPKHPTTNSQITAAHVARNLIACVFAMCHGIFISRRLMAGPLELDLKQAVAHFSSEDLDLECLRGVC